MLPGSWFFWWHPGLFELSVPVHLPTALLPVYLHILSLLSLGPDLTFLQGHLSYWIKVTNGFFLIWLYLWES